MKKYWAACLLPLACMSQAWASPVVVDELTGYTLSAATESIVGGNEYASLVEFGDVAHIDGIQWAGSFSRSAELSGASDLQFLVRFYDDAGVGPNAVIAEQWIMPTFAPEIAESNWGETFQYGGLFSSTLNVSLNPGKVWISVSAKIEGDQFWYGGAFEPNTLEGVIGTGGSIKVDSASPWIAPNEEVTMYEGRGRALALEGTIGAVPEPSTYAFMGLGLLMMAGVARTRRQ